MKRDQTYINELLSQYREGSISETDRHELERIALDDPFVFDSLEGYSTGVDQMSNDAIDRIQSKTSAPQGRIINMRTISIAAGIAILIGGLFWVNGLLNQADLESFSQLDVEEAIVENEAVPNDGRIDSVADFAVGKMEDLSRNASSSELLEDSSGSTDDTPVVSNTTDKPTPPEPLLTEIANVESPSPVTSVVIDQEQYVTDHNDQSRQIENHNSTIITSTPKQKIESEAAMAKAPVDVAQPSVVESTSARSRATNSTGAVQKKKESIATNSDPFGDVRTTEITKAQMAINGKRLISGLVRDNTGEPLIGVTVLVPDSDIGIATGIDGSFALEIDSTFNQLEIAYVGYEDLVVDLDKKSSYDIILDEGASLDEVVVTGYASNVNEDNPSFVLPPNGRSAYKKVIQSKSESGCNQSGKVRLKFTVNKYGEVFDFEVKKGLTTACDKRAIDIIKNSGTWNNQFNKDKKVRYTVSF